MTYLRSLSDLFRAARKLAAACALAIAVATAAAAQDTNTFPGGGNVGVLSASYECEGNACSVVTLTWEEDGQQFRVDNSSDQRVKVEVTTFAGTSSITVEPQKSDYLRVTYFNGPYHANYEQLVSRTSRHAAAFLIDRKYSRSLNGDSWNTN